SYEGGGSHSPRGLRFVRLSRRSASAGRSSTSRLVRLDWRTRQSYETTSGADLASAGANRRRKHDFYPIGAVLERRPDSRRTRRGDRAIKGASSDAWGLACTS